MAKRLWEDKYLSPEQMELLLSAVEQHQDHFRMPARAHAMLFLGYHLGLRISELCLLRREHFDLQRGRAIVPTLKQAERIKIQCECGRKIRVASKRAGGEYPCDKCFARIPVRGKVDEAVKLVEIAFVESGTVRYLRDYVKKLPADQQHLFVHHRTGKRSTRFDLYKDFRRARELAGLSRHVPHGLRHGRGQFVHLHTRDPKAVQAALRHKSVNSSLIYTHMENEQKHRASLERDTTYRKPI